MVSFGNDKYLFLVHSSYFKLFPHIWYQNMKPVVEEILQSRQRKSKQDKSNLHQLKIISPIVSVSQRLLQRKDVRHFEQFSSLINAGALSPDPDVCRVHGARLLARLPGT